jgi:segregation and condensation protein A
MVQEQESYRVSLAAFEGPLDLLLYLVRRAEIDVQEVSIAMIADQYLATLAAVDEVDIELAGEFLVMAATLIEMKSRSLVPAEKIQESEARGDGTGDPLDPRHSLIQQLLAYQRFRTAGELLDKDRVTFWQRHRCIVDARAGYEKAFDPDDIDIEDAHILDLAQRYEEIAASIDFSRLGGMHLEIDDTPLELHQEDLLDRLQRRAGRPLSLQQTFDGKKLVHRVGLFLATLELVRQRRIVVEQEETQDEIMIRLSMADDDQDEVIIDSPSTSETSPSP